ncbi:MAG: hypothetical protein LBI38_00335 [Oscillospiraceae bacterium]|jgi:hypothetical protein|nr:hypothetical protein [Oscillospiraceae bacterium]
MILDKSDFIKIENIKTGDDPLDIWVIQGGGTRAFNPDDNYGSFDIFMADGCLYIRHDGSDEEMGVYFDSPAVSDAIGTFGIVELLDDNSFADKGRYVFPRGKNRIILKKADGGILLGFSEYRPNAQSTPNAQSAPITQDKEIPADNPENGFDGDIKKRLENLKGDIKADIGILGGIDGGRSAMVAERLSELEEIAGLLENAMAELVERRNKTISEHLSNG